MKWAAVTLVALSALCVPTALRAQEETFTAAFVRDALAGFGEAFLRQSNCFLDRRSIEPLRIAVAQMERSRQFRKDEEQIITDRIEEALRRDFFLQVAPMRGRWSISEAMKQLGDAKSQASRAPASQATADQLEGIIIIRPDAGRSVNVAAYAGLRCTGPQRTIAVGRIARTSDVPEKFFEDAAMALPDKKIEQLMVMRPDIADFGDSIPARVMARRLQRELKAAIDRFFQTAPHLNVTGTIRPDVREFEDGVEVPGAWQAELHLSPAPGGIDARLDLHGPGNQPGGFSESGFFAPDVLPADSDPAVVAEVEAVCGSIRQALDAESDPDTLQALARKNQCPALHDDLVKKEASLRDRICNEDRAHWSDAVNGSVEAMESAVRTIRCRQVLDDAQKDIRRRKEFEAVIARIKSRAADLGTLTDGRIAEGKDHVGADDASGFWKFEMADADTVEVQLDDETGNLSAELHDSPGTIIARSRQIGPGLKEIDTADRLNPGAYYIRVVPADGQRGAAYALRVAKSHIDTAGQSVATARDLGSLGKGVLTIHEHIGGIDRGDIFKFTTQERMLLKLTAGDTTSDVHLDLLNQSAQPVWSSSYGPGHEQQNVEWAVEPRSTYYIAVTPNGRSTPYSLGIALFSVAPFSRPEIAAPVSIGTTPSVLTHSLSSNDDAYYAKFVLRELSPVSIDLTWDGQRTAYNVDLFKEGGGLRSIQPRSVTHAASSRSVSDDLAPGTYIVKVTRDAGSSPATPFTLTLHGGTWFPSKDKAASLSVGAAPVVYTLPANQNDYWGKFSVSEVKGTRVSIVLGWSDPQNSLRLHLENDRGVIPFLPNDGQIVSTLAPGTYWVHVSRAGGAGAVPLHLNLSRLLN